MYLRLTQNLLDIERKHHVLQRWLPTDQLYKDVEGSIMVEKKKEQILLQILNTGQQRMFLLQLKKKYAGM